MDVNKTLDAVADRIAILGPTGLSVKDFRSTIRDLVEQSDDSFENYLWKCLTSLKSIDFYTSSADFVEPFQHLPKVVYNTERTLAIIENEESNSKFNAKEMRTFKTPDNWKKVSKSIEEQRLSLSDVEKKYENLRLVTKFPEVTQLSGVWDPLVPVPSKCSVLVNHLSRVGPEGTLSCGVGSPLNTAINVKPNAIFHFKKISQLYNMIRWRKILVKKARLSRTTTNGTCAILPRFVSPSFLLPDRMITLAKQLANYICKESPVGRCVEVRHCSMALNWSSKQIRSVVNCFPDIFTVQFLLTLEISLHFFLFSLDIKKFLKHHN